MPGNGGGAPGAASTGSVSSTWPLSSSPPRSTSTRSPLRLAGREGDNVPPGNAGKPGGGKAPLAPGWFCGSIGLLWAWPSAAYELVMESMTDWAFSWPISAVAAMSAQVQAAGRTRACPQYRRKGQLTLVVVDDVADVVSAAVVSLAHAHRVVRKVHIAVVAWRLEVSIVRGIWYAFARGEGGECSVSFARVRSRGHSELTED